MRPTRDRLGVALMPLAVLLVHELRYRLAFGDRTASELAADGHGYLGSLLPFAVIAAALGVGLWLRRAALALGAGERPVRGSLVRLWLLTAAALVAVYAGQELLEGALAPGHPAGVVGVFGHGGVWALPSATTVGGALALLLHGAQRALELIATARLRVPHPRAIALLRGHGARRGLRRTLAPLARAAAGRAPPALA